MQIRTEVEIVAPPEKVWSVFSDFKELPSWQKWLVIHNPASAEGLEPAQSMSVTLTPEGGSPFNVSPVVLVNKKAEEFRWRGKLMGMGWLFVGEHYFLLKALPQGRTLFVHGEDFSGCLVPVAKGTIATAEAEFGKFNAKLKDKVERSG